MSIKAYDLIVIGGGPAGEKGAAQAAYFGKRVALVGETEDSAQRKASLTWSAGPVTVTMRAAASSATTQAS